MKKVSFWFKNARPVSLPQSIMPTLVAVALSIGQEDFRWYLALIAAIGICLAHLSMNLFDDYFDYRKKETGFRDVLVREGVRARTAKCPYLTSGQATVKQLLWACIIFGTAACLCGVVVLVIRGLPVLWIVLATAILGISYSADPLRLSYRGLGELVIGILFGPLLVMGISLASCGEISYQVIFIGICMGLFVINIIYTHSVLDYEADLRVGKTTLAGHFKSNKSKLFASFLFNFVPYLLVIACVISGIMSVWYLCVLVTLPWAIQMFTSLVSFTRDPDKKVKKMFWHGPMSNWELICQAGLDWFLFRWFMARNMLTAFALLFIAVSVLLAVYA